MPSRVAPQSIVVTRSSSTLSSAVSSTISVCQNKPRAASSSRNPTCTPSCQPSRTWIYYYTIRWLLARHWNDIDIDAHNYPSLPVPEMRPGLELELDSGAPTHLTGKFLCQARLTSGLADESTKSCVIFSSYPHSQDSASSTLLDDMISWRVVYSSIYFVTGISFRHDSFTPTELFAISVWSSYVMVGPYKVKQCGIGAALAGPPPSQTDLLSYKLGGVPQVVQE